MTRASVSESLGLTKPRLPFSTPTEYHREPCLDGRNQVVINAR